MNPRHSALLLGLLAGACAGDTAGQMFVAPGRFDYLHCTEIAQSLRHARQREQELKTLIERAEQDALGSLIATASYRGDYLRAQTEQKMLAEVAQRKNCAAEATEAQPSQSPATRRR